MNDPLSPSDKQAPPDLHLIEPPWRRWTLILWALPMVAGGIYLLLPPDSETVFGLGLSAFGALLAALGVGHVRRGGNQITATSEGLNDRWLGVGTIPWSSVLSLDLTRFQNKTCIAIGLKEAESWRSKQPPRSRGASVQDQFHIDIGGYSMPGEDIATLLLQHVLAARPEEDFKG